MKKISKNYLFFVLISLLFFTSGCVNTGTSILSLNYKPLVATVDTSSQLANIKLVNFQDFRDGISEPEIIGHRDALGLDMGDVKVERPIVEIINNAFSSELIHNGYNIVKTGEGVTITGKILNFWVGTDSTALYWDVYGEVRIEVEVINVNGETTKIGPYYAKNVERTYTDPSVPIMERVLLASLNEVFGKIISDKGFAK